TVAAAFAAVVETDAARAAIVGPNASAFTRDVSGVDAHDVVSDADFDAWVARAAVLVQLRADSNGESSGVVARALAVGTPLIVTAIGAMRELPDDVAVKVPVDIGAADLAEVIVDVLGDGERRRAMSVAAARYAAANSYRDQARRIIAAITR